MNSNLGTKKGRALPKVIPASGWGWLFAGCHYCRRSDFYTARPWKNEYDLKAAHFHTAGLPGFHQGRYGCTEVCFAGETTLPAVRLSKQRTTKHMVNIRTGMEDGIPFKLEVFIGKRTSKYKLPGINLHWNLTCSSHQKRNSLKEIIFLKGGHSLLLKDCTSLLHATAGNWTK